MAALIPTSAHGGGSSFVGCRVAMSGFSAGWTGTAIPFDVLDWDSDGFWDAANFQFVIPAGKAGLYSVTGQVQVHADPAITSGFVFLEGNDPDPFYGSQDFMLQKGGGTGAWLAVVAADIYCHEGDAVYLDGVVNGPASAQVVAGCSLVYRGTPTLLI